MTTVCPFKGTAIKYDVYGVPATATDYIDDISTPPLYKDSNRREMAASWLMESSEPN